MISSWGAPTRLAITTTGVTLRMLKGARPQVTIRWRQVLAARPAPVAAAGWGNPAPGLEILTTYGVFAMTVGATIMSGSNIAAGLADLINERAEGDPVPESGTTVA